MPRPGIPVRVHLDPWEEPHAGARGLRATSAGCGGHPSRTLLPQGGHGVPLQICAYCKWDFDPTATFSDDPAL